MGVEWETPENIQRAKASLDFVLKGCKCKTGCSTRRCSCRHKDSICGPGCQCLNCANTHTHPPTSESTDATSQLEVLDMLEEEQQEEEYVSDSSDDLDEQRVDKETTEVMLSVFGEDSEDDV